MTCLLGACHQPATSPGADTFLWQEQFAVFKMD